MNHLIMIKTIGGRSIEECRQIGLAVANSNLVKTAIHGGDPNWGRIWVAIGNAGVDSLRPEAIAIRIHEFVCRSGTAVPFDLPRLRGLLSGGEVQIEIEVGHDGH